MKIICEQAAVDVETVSLQKPERILAEIPVWRPIGAGFHADTSQRLQAQLHHLDFLLELQGLRVFVGVTVMPNLVSRGRDFAAELGPSVDGMARDAKCALDLVLVEKTHQARHSDLCAELAARHVSGRSTVEANPQRLCVEVATEVDSYLLARGNSDLAPYLWHKILLRISFCFEAYARLAVVCKDIQAELQGLTPSTKLRCNAGGFQEAPGRRTRWRKPLTW